MDRHKVKEMDLYTKIEDLKKKNSEGLEEIKDLKAIMYESQRILRKIPHDKQIYYNANSDIFDYSNYS